MVEESRDGFPFEIEENPGRETMLLTRDFKGEKISVEVYMPSLVAEFGEIPLTVKVVKKSGVYLEFAAGVDNGELAIVSLTINDTKAKDDSLASRAPAFKDLDDDLQKAFHKYLDRRKISAQVVEFLQEYTTDKDTMEYFNWYNTVKHFVKSDSG
ncbi:complement component [Lithospermum erythrorhizon]|uniref:Complement component n=1 Tax=Lithospermum erythrorhizon TaxID=34254 RepID=A0AAV3PMQ6_LITER